MLQVWVVLEIEVLPLEHDRVVEVELRSSFEDFWETIHRKVHVARVRNIGEHEGNIVGCGLGSDRGQSGAYKVRDARNGAIHDGENGSGGVDVRLDLSCNTVLLGLVLLRTASIGEPWRVQDANLGKSLRPLVTSTDGESAYHHAVVVCIFIEAGLVGLTLNTSLVLVVKDFKVVVINVVASKDIGDEFQNRGLAGMSLSKKNDGVWCRCLAL